MTKIEAAGMRVVAQNFWHHYDQSRTAHFPVLVEEASSRQSLFCKIGTFSCGVIFCRDNRDLRKLTNTSGSRNLDASSARQTFAVQKPDNQDRATAAGSRSVLFPADLTCLVAWIMGQDTQCDLNSATQFVASSRASREAGVSNTVERSIHFILPHELEEYTFVFCIRSSRPMQRNTSIPSSAHLLPARTQVLVLWNFHCVAARIACSMIANTSPLATCSICKQSNTRPKASPLA